MNEDLPKIEKYNIRVYGLILVGERIVLSDEFSHNMHMTKFPGGGMVFGEGPVECLRREIMEELSQEIEIVDHFYTTHFFQRALFYEDQQLISIYYLAKLKEKPKFRITEKPFDVEPGNTECQSFRMVPVSEVTDDDLSFPIDKYVFNLLKNNIKPGY
jgi:8-oxo-dGTP diphosphatase